MNTTEPRHRYMRAVVHALGGAVPTAYHGKVSVQAVYNWIRAGHISQSRSLLRIVDVARRQRLRVWGEPIAPEVLAGLAEPPAPPPEAATPKSGARTGRRLRLVEPEAAVEAARAKLDDRPPRVYGTIRGRNNWPLLAA